LEQEICNKQFGPLKDENIRIFFVREIDVEKAFSYHWTFIFSHKIVSAIISFFSNSQDTKNVFCKIWKNVMKILNSTKCHTFFKFFLRHWRKKFHSRAQNYLQNTFNLPILLMEKINLNEKRTFVQQ